MAENIKELIEKIQAEGVDVAQEKARKIEVEAEKAREEILKNARQEAEKIISDAKEKISKMEQAGRVSLQQSSRDMLLSIRKAIFSLLNKVILEETQKILSPAELAKIISSVIKSQAAGISGEVVVHLNKEDLEKLEDTFLEGLKEILPKGIEFKPEDGIKAGFIISYDGDKSHFDFSDKSLAEYLGSHVKPKLAEILKEAAI